MLNEMFPKDQELIQCLKIKRKVNIENEITFPQKIDVLGTNGKAMTIFK